MLTIGLTGGIATGKSTVSALLRQVGFPIVDADIVAREVVEPGTPTLEKIKLAFGPGIIDNGVLDRRKLGQIVFEDGAQLKKLNDIMQPAISSAMADKINFWRLQNVPILVLDVPLLFERDYDKNKLVDKIIVVTASEEIQLSRLENRDQLSNMEARNRVKAQLPMSQKIARADYVIDNNGRIEELQEQVTVLIKKIKEIASTHDAK
ncbi:dephospho-CoA kinase [Leuconostoc mesenteroides]|uniref:Dephospho-CoA kinase n=1 Tax=Leuconostoc mesenteroides subsp. cremoris ATCC 19254 TaxID=586220 RepID=C2KL94_LEUMC|nr:dephospho-CoA kinase [Leuconostoc mesenteroides]KDA52492.1 Dephospho-CoA kinase [Leuconostoc mesenteroides subsp. cremoris T26]EEJ42001.1 dephospho-CoA kinase [Leuconostoc mesenteroides subsp. cremoris ATCC 19254]MDG9749633.1 dephospho-CoA kinase [Leuconostoc mesenteroides]ORI37721.1 dephospho-CoA kinase [Leuconostoc mesenteroides subsp. cremoris]ORI38102.1 dephospho-CoA kinase [Leuconostoc mesenteroides subsp. cremoris]